jgi:VWFA-related protein
MRRRTFSAGLTIVMCVVFGLFAGARGFSQSSAQTSQEPQTPPKPESPSAKQGGSQSGTLRVASRLVQVNVIVQDRNGQPVTGLTKKDFTILDQGQPQTIASFSEQTNRLTSGATAAAAPAPNSFSNRFEERYGAPPTVSILLIDSLNMLNNSGNSFSQGNMTLAREQAIKFLRQLQPQDRVALYFLSNKIYILHDFTTDKAALLRTLGGAPHLQQDPANAAPPMDFAPFTGDAKSDATLDYAVAAIGRAKEENTIDRAGRTTAALEVIANHLASYPGRKNLIWISSSFPWQIGYGQGFEVVPTDMVLFSKWIDPAAHALSNANVALYPVDARGLMVDRAPDAFNSGAGNTADAWTVDTMVVFADETGGRVFHNTNDIAGSIHRAIEDSRLTYVLSYYPNHNQWDGRFRQIKVKVDRPGVDVRSRRGYFAFPNATVSPKDKEEIMVDAAKNSLESAGLGMDVHVDPVDVPGARQIKAQVKIDAAQLLLAKTGDRWTDSVDVKWVQLSTDGNVLASSSQTLDLNIPWADYENFLRKGLSFSGSVSLMSGTTDVRLVARDSGNGSVGTVNIPLAKLFTPDSAPNPVKK